MTDKKKRRARALTEKTGMSHQAAVNILDQEKSRPALVGSMKVRWDDLHDSQLSTVHREDGDVGVTFVESRALFCVRGRDVIAPVTNLTDATVREQLATLEQMGCHRAVVCISSKAERSVVGFMVRSAWLAKGGTSDDEELLNLFYLCLPRPIAPLDATPIASDWDDFTALWNDMRHFKTDNPDHVVVRADDPGFNHESPRIPRLGWIAYREYDACVECKGAGCTACGGLGRIPSTDEKEKEWTITLPLLHATAGPHVLEAVKTVIGSVNMLRGLDARQDLEHTLRFVGGMTVSWEMLPIGGLPSTIYPTAKSSTCRALTGQAWFRLQNQDALSVARPRCRTRWCRRCSPR